MKNKRKPAGIYVHIPFCRQKCGYCDFLSASVNCLQQEEYLKAVEREIEAYEYLTDGYLIKTIYIGGGTPSILEGRKINRLIEKINSVFLLDKKSEDIEITIECNPGTLTKEKLISYKAGGVNRLSIGLQSTDNNLLKMLGRFHTYEQFLETYHSAKETGFDNINIDVMSALPGQTLQMYIDTLKKVAELNPKHISSYSLILEKGTPFYEKYYGKERELPSEEEERLMYEITNKILSENNYIRYEISNYAKAGYESRHNSSYWTCRDYIGIGLGASSLIHKKRYRNETDLSAYIKNSSDLSLLRKEEVSLTKENQMEEFMFLGLRMAKGISAKEFEHRFQEKIDTVYPKSISDLKEKGLLLEDSGQIFLSEKGIDVSNYVFTYFLLDDKR